MKHALASLRVTAQTSLSDLLATFESATVDLIVIDTRSIITEPHLELLTDYPRNSSAALVAAKKGGDTRIEQNRVISASSATHQVTAGNREFVGAIRLSQNQREPIITALRGAIAHNVAGHALDLALVALVRARVRVDAVDIWGAPYLRSDQAAERSRVAAEINGLKMERVRLSMANRANDGFFSVFVLRKFSKILTWVAVRIGATPNQVTLVSFAIGLYSAYSFSRGTFIGALSGALLLQLSIIVDCVDGELARYTRRFSKLGAWLDAVTDRIKEYLVFLGLAYGAARQGEDLWLPALAMMALQTFRHLSDYNFAQTMKIRNESKYSEPIDFLSSFDGVIPSEREAKGRLRYWLGKIIQFPIGERWLVIGASAVIGGATFTFTVMPILALISMVVVYRGRIRRTLQLAKTALPSPLIANQTDLLGVKRTFMTRSSWIEPSLIRLLELSILIALLVEEDLLGAPTFLLILSIIFNHYDNLYRALQSEAKPTWLSALGLYVGGRVLLIGAFTYAGWSLTPLVWYFAVLFFAISSIQWVVSHRQNKVR